MTTEQILLADIEAFIERNGMAESAFGRGALNDWKFVASMRRGRRVWPTTEGKVRAFMQGHEASLPTKVQPVAFHNASEMKGPHA